LDTAARRVDDRAMNRAIVLLALAAVGSGACSQRAREEEKRRALEKVLEEQQRTIDEQTRQRDELERRLKEMETPHAPAPKVQSDGGTKGKPMPAPCKCNPADPLCSCF
jgi:septal ring factor EnvC (AmiA/AmiB activator)